MAMSMLSTAGKQFKDFFGCLQIQAANGLSSPLQRSGSTPHGAQGQNVSKLGREHQGHGQRRNWRRKTSETDTGCAISALILFRRKGEREREAGREAGREGGRGREGEEGGGR